MPAMFGSMQEGLDALRSQNKARAARGPLVPYRQQLLNQQPSPLAPAAPAPAALARSTGLAPAPTTQAGYDQQMAQQNPGGQHFGGLLPTLGTSPSGAQRPVFMAPPAQPSTANPGFDPKAWAQSRGLSVHPETGTISPNSALSDIPGGQVRSMQTQGYANPGLGFNKHVAAAPVAQADRYKALGLTPPSERSGGLGQTARQFRTARDQEQQQQNFERGLGAMNPAAYAQLQQGRGQQALASSQMQATNAYRNQALAQQKEVALAQIEGANQRANTAVLGKGIDPKTGLAITPPSKPEPYEQPPALAQLGGRISEGLAGAMGFTGTSNLPPVAHPTRAGRPRLGPPGQVNNLRKPIGPEHLIPQPGDNPVQAQARADLRKKHSGLRTQLEIAGRLQPGQ